MCTWMNITWMNVCTDEYVRGWICTWQVEGKRDGLKVRALVALAENQGLSPSIYMVVHSHP